MAPRPTASRCDSLVVELTPSNVDTGTNDDTRDRPPDATASDQTQLATFYVADMCLALDIGLIQEIIRDVKITRVPHAPPQVRGVINLRGEVTTVIDLRPVLGLPPAAASRQPQTLIVRSQGESIGLIVDRVGDIYAVEARASCRRRRTWAASTAGFFTASASGRRRSFWCSTWRKRCRLSQRRTRRPLAC